MTEPGMLQVVLMGIITVFVVLVCLIVIIKILGAVVGKGSARKTAPAVAAPAAAAPVAAATAAPNKQQMVAAIASVIAEEMGADVDHIKIHSIRKL